MNPSAIGEASIPQPVQQAVAPDVQSPQGQSQLFQKAVEAHRIKPLFDAMLKKIASSVGGESSSRVKQLETMAAKITQKRLQNRDYGINDINDALGGRIIVNDNSKINAAKAAVQSLAKQGVFKINEAEKVKQGTYRGFHFDVTLPNGMDGEIQLHTRHSAAEAILNHDLRAIHGENPKNDAVKQLRDTQAKVVDALPGDKALAVAKAVQGLREQNKGKPISPAITAGLLAQAKGGEH